jgi:histidine ammonia-lyase
VPAPLREFAATIASISPFVAEDRALEHDLRALTARIAACALVDVSAEEPRHG